ncbi:MAG TPA: helix-turn-helix domain-containing protein [Rubrobacter sp.]|nr:helix-turn-helix domain-containing protein [Rubrobacter sp.]
MGRISEQAPKGHITVREASEILGVSDQAIRNRIERGTLVTKEVPLPGGGRRHYLPRSVIEAEAEKPPGNVGASGEIHIIIHDPYRPQTVRVQTGRKGTSIHLGG